MALMRSFAPSFSEEKRLLEGKLHGSGGLREKIAPKKFHI